jgi:8-oxo-dGTP pyrophosphatase MutT (NUDIX family)
MVIPSPAATVILLRPESDGFSVFLVQRNRAVGFMPNAWVFPGGRVEADDRLLGHPAVHGGLAAVAAMGLDAADAMAFLVAAVRETFEESGVWLGEGMPRERRTELGRGGKGLPALLAETGAVIHLDRLAPWAHWVTPSVEPRRFDTRFLVAIAPDDLAVHDSGETVASGWMRPAEAIAKAERGELPMAPPTWWTLVELAREPDVDAVIAAAYRRSQRPIEPIARFDGGEFELLLPGHPNHPEPACDGLPTHVKFVQGRWWADGHTGAAPPFAR